MRIAIATTQTPYVIGGAEYLATGHRGFNGEGSEVKLWDLRNFSAESTLFDFKEH